MSDLLLRNRLIRLAHDNAKIRPLLLPLLREACECGGEASVTGKFEAGKPADPTENMTEEQKKKWWVEHDKNKDKFKSASKKATDPKAEILAVMLQLFDAAERKFGREAIDGAFAGATTDAFKSILGSKPMSDIKKLQGLLVWPVQDAAWDQNPERDFQLSGDDPRSNYARGDGKRTLGVPRLDLSPEAAGWFNDLRDAVQFSLARQVLVAKAKQHGTALDRGMTIYAAKATGAGETKSKIRLASGMVIPQGTLVKAVDFERSHPALATLHFAGLPKPVKVSTKNLYAYLEGYTMPPSRAEMQKMAKDGKASTPTGAQAPHDGWATDGSPSWLVALGYA